MSEINEAGFTIAGRAIGLDQRLFIIAGPCVIESEAMALSTAETLKRIASDLGILLIYKSSFDKANRSSGSSFRGPGLAEGLRILAKVRESLDIPVLTDVHEVAQVRPVADVVDMLQTPAFLARQTDLIEAVAAAGKPVNIKKGQFMAPLDMRQVAEKARTTAGAAGLPFQITVCDRGSSFGYNNLITDMRGLVQMRETACPVVFDATHSVQLPGAQGSSSGGQREFVPVLARAAVAVGIAGLFMETHPDPANAKSDGPNAVPLDQFAALASELVELDQFVKSRGMIRSSIP
jgi:2-dehydro-3-deoxyphosphooctonate aldolase (KDO 8-P synthase)